jgi:hypothetical protein
MEAEMSEEPDYEDRDYPILPNGEDLDEMLHFDPLRAAERITKVSYKESELTSGWGLILQMRNSEMKANALKELDDTCFSEKMENYARIIEGVGFRKVLELDFTTNNSYESVERQEKYFIYWHDDGLLLTCDTFHLTDRNAAKVWYNWRPNKTPASVPPGTLSSGCYHFDDGLPHIYQENPEDPDPNEGRSLYWAGDHDAREAIRHNLTKLREHGTFIKPWKQVPFLWLLHHGDTANKKPSDFIDYKKINAERYAMLPQEVTDCIQYKG